MARGRTALAVVLAAVVLTAAAPPTASAQDTVSLTAEQSGSGDTVVFELGTQDGFSTLDESYLKVEAALPSGTQRVAVVGGIVQDGTSTHCNGPCFLDMHAATIEDVAASTQPAGNGDLRLDTGPGLDVRLETGHDHVSYGWVKAGIGLANLSFPADGDTTYQLVLSVPAATYVDAELHVVAEGDVNLTDQRLLDTGFDHWTDDMRAAGAHTAASSIYVGSDFVCGQGCGEVTVDPGSDRLYGAIGPTQAGFYTAHADPTGTYCEGCLGVIPATFAGSWGYASPGEFARFTGAGIVAATPPTAAVLAVAGATGDTTFFVDSFVSAGPQDLVAAGFTDPG